MSKPRVTFYDLPPEGRWPLIARLAEAAWTKGRRMAIHCADPGVARELDNYLWIFREDAFVPHEVRLQPDEVVDAEARIVLTAGDGCDFEADVLVQEAPLALDEAERFGSVIDIVDHRDLQLLEASRARFRSWRERDVVPGYRKH